MNLVLFESHELEVPLPADDRRAQHVLKVLKRTEGDSFDAGIVNGARGKATLVQVAPSSITVIFDADRSASPTAEPVTLLIGLPRPQTARDVLRDATTLGVGALHFVRCEKSEASYAQSTLWSSGEWRRHLILGAEQAFDTRIPTVTHGAALEATLAGLAETPLMARLALDNYEAAKPLAASVSANAPGAVIAIGPERGWSAHERDLLREHGFTLAHLGTRVLRTETAVVAALTLVRTKLGLM